MKTFIICPTSAQMYHLTQRHCSDKWVGKLLSWFHIYTHTHTHTHTHIKLIYGFVCWTNEHISFLLPRAMQDTRVNFSYQFLKVFNVSEEKSSTHFHNSGKWRKSKDLIKTLFRFGGCCFLRINIKSLKPLRLFLMRVFHTGFYYVESV